MTTFLDSLKRRPLRCNKNCRSDPLSCGKEFNRIAKHVSDGLRAQARFRERTNVVTVTISEDKTVSAAMLQATMAGVGARLEDRNKEVDEANTARTKAKAAPSSLEEKVAEENRGWVASKVNVVEFRVRLAEEHRAKAVGAGELEATRREAALLHQRLMYKPISAEAVKARTADVPWMVDVGAVTGSVR